MTWPQVRQSLMRVDRDNRAIPILRRHRGEYYRGLALKTADFNDGSIGGSAGSENAEEANFILRKETRRTQRKASSTLDRVVKILL